MTNHLFTSFKLRSIEFKNRIFVSPMCQYSSHYGNPQPWHLVHLGSRAVGGAACVIQESTAISAQGRISPNDLGIWNDAQMEAYKPITHFIKEQGAIPGIQISHAGRKASVCVPWEGGKGVEVMQGGWPVIEPSELPFSKDTQKQHAMSEAEIGEVVQSVKRAAERSLIAGYQVMEIHAAHGYLFHEFLSPLSNGHTVLYGGSFGKSHAAYA